MKFSIRDLFLVTAIVALAVAWWLDRSKLSAVRRDAEDDARYLSQSFADPADPFVDAKSKELYRKYHTAPKSRTPAPNPIQPWP